MLPCRRKDVNRKALEPIQFNRAIPSDPDWGLGIWTDKFDESSNGSKDLELLSLAIKTNWFECLMIDHRPASHSGDRDYPCVHQDQQKGGIDDHHSLGLALSVSHGEYNLTTKTLNIFTKFVALEKCFHSIRGTLGQTLNYNPPLRPPSQATEFGYHGTPKQLTSAYFVLTTLPSLVMPSTNNATTTINNIVVIVDCHEKPWNLQFLATTDRWEWRNGAEMGKTLFQSI
jgi:hypothetical protein